MEHKTVQSTNVKSVAYDKANLVMEVRFHNGGLYQYLGVRPEHHAALMQAPSIGKHLHAHFKGKYTTIKVEEKEAA